MEENNTELEIIKLALSAGLAVGIGIATGAGLAIGVGIVIIELIKMVF